MSSQDPVFFSVFLLVLDGKPECAVPPGGRMIKSPAQHSENLKNTLRPFMLLPTFIQNVEFFDFSRNNQ